MSGTIYNPFRTSSAIPMNTDLFGGQPGLARTGLGAITADPSVIPEYQIPVFRSDWASYLYPTFGYLPGQGPPAPVAPAGPPASAPATTAPTAPTTTTPPVVPSEGGGDGSGIIIPGSEGMTPIGTAPAPGPGGGGAGLTSVGPAPGPGPGGGAGAPSAGGTPADTSPSGVVQSVLDFLGLGSGAGVGRAAGGALLGTLGGLALGPLGAIAMGVLGRALGANLGSSFDTPPDLVGPLGQAGWTQAVETEVANRVAGLPPASQQALASNLQQVAATTAPAASAPAAGNGSESGRAATSAAAPSSGAQGSGGSASAAAGSGNAGAAGGAGGSSGSGGAASGGGGTGGGTGSGGGAGSGGDTAGASGGTGGEAGMGGVGAPGSTSGIDNSVADVAAALGVDPSAVSAAMAATGVTNAHDLSTPANALGVSVTDLVGAVATGDKSAITAVPALSINYANIDPIDVADLEIGPDPNAMANLDLFADFDDPGAAATAASAASAALGIDPFAGFDDPGAAAAAAQAATAGLAAADEQAAAADPGGGPSGGRDGENPGDAGSGAGPGGGRDGDNPGDDGSGGAGAGDGSDGSGGGGGGGGAGDGSDGSGGGGSDGGGGGGSEGGDGSDGSGFTGGWVTSNRLFGPDPEGPDDGLMKLDVGEFIVPAAQAQMHRPMLERIRSGLPPGLGGMDEDPMHEMGMGDQMEDAAEGEYEHGGGGGGFMPPVGADQMMIERARGMAPEQKAQVATTLLNDPTTAMALLELLGPGFEAILDEIIGGPGQPGAVMPGPVHPGFNGAPPMPMPTGAMPRGMFGG